MKWLLGIALSAAVAMPAMARDALDFATLESGKIRRSVDLSAFAPPADATPPSHQFEGRLAGQGCYRASKRADVPIASLVRSTDW